MSAARGHLHLIHLVHSLVMLQIHLLQYCWTPVMVYRLGDNREDVSKMKEDPYSIWSGFRRTVLINTLGFAEHQEEKKTINFER